MEDVESFLSAFAKFREVAKKSKAISGQGVHLRWRIGQKNTNLVEDVEHLNPVKFLQVPFSEFREVERASVSKRLGGHLR